MLSANTNSGLRGDYSRIRDDYTVDQADQFYTDADHALWRRLHARQSALVPRYAAQEFARGLALMDCAQGVPDIAMLSRLLQSTTGWTLAAVPGFLPDEAFFKLLAARRFPVTVWLRRPEEADYLVEPDIFHDVFGHVPMLFDARYADFVQRYGQAGLAAMRDGALSMAARLYWYTVEFGLIESAGELRAYGSGILSSAGETAYAIESERARRIRLDLDRCLRTHYMIDAYQQTYFVIGSMEELVDADAGELARRMRIARDLGTLQPDQICDGDRIVAPRTPARVCAPA